MKTIKYMFLFLGFLVAFAACKEQERYEIGYSDSLPPTAPEFLRYERLHGGARLFYKIPTDEDLLSIDASYVNPQGKKVWFSVSYFQKSIDVYGFGDTLAHEVQLYAVDRAGNKSELVPVTVIPMEPAYSRVAKSVVVKAGFGSFFLDWENELMQTINVYIDFSYTKDGKLIEHHLIYTSPLPNERWFIRDLEEVTVPVTVKFRVEDAYGNITKTFEKPPITLLQDQLIPKKNWYLPNANDSVGGEPMAFLESAESRKTFLYDDIIDGRINVNYTSTGGVGRTGLSTLPNGQNVNRPWNLMIDLGAVYEISRIVTHQRYYTGAGYTGTTGRGRYYGDENIGIYNMYVMNESGEWEYASQHKILFNEGLSELEFMQMGQAGDMAYLYPDEPQFSRPTRWFRYEALWGFNNNYTATNINCLSEVTLYGRKVSD
jgi:hypothetical protein